MKVVIDSNILFSACIAPFGDNADLLLNPRYNFEKLTCHYLIVEIFKHQEKIVKLSQQNTDNVLDVLYTIMRKITFINEELISNKNWVKADEITKETDNKDIAFVALTLHIPDSILWTNDMKLIKGIQKNGFNRVITTHDLLQKYKDFDVQR
jgi:predicted nucleic acid-binding protein